MRHGRAFGMTALVTAGAVVSLLAAAAPASANGVPKSPAGVFAISGAPAVTYKVYIIDNSHDLTYNALSFINKYNTIAGFYGSATFGHPAKGYIIRPPYRQSNFKALNYPRSAQTEVLGMNDFGYVVGTYSYTDKKSGANAWYGFWEHAGHFHRVVYKTSHNSNPIDDSLTGINDKGFATGDYLDASGHWHPFRYDTRKRSFSIPIQGAPSITASSINNRGAIVGFFRLKGPWISYVTLHGRLTAKFTVPVKGVARTEAQGLNDKGTVVGYYTRSGKYRAFIRTSSGVFHEYYYKTGTGLGFDSVSNTGKIVGWYIDKNGHYHGLLLIPG